MAQPNTDALFRKLHSNIEEEEHDEVLEVAGELLKLLPGDDDVVKIKCTSMLHEGDFKGALKFITAHTDKDLLFHKAYAHYRLKQHKEALDCIHSIPADRKTAAIWHLEAQVHYRDHRFDQCVEIYEKQFSVKEMDVEAKTNLLASYVSAGMPSRALQLMIGSEQATFESAYNTACAMLDTGDLQGAMSKLQTAQQVCRSALQADDYSDSEIKDEMAVITVQQAYLMQLEGKTKEAMEIYTSVLHGQPSDEAVVATASNNIVSLRTRDEKIFDSRKRITRAANVPASKLLPRQQRAIQLNRCLLLVYEKKGAKASEIVADLHKQFPESEFPVLLHASLLFHEKKHEESLAVLRAHLKQPNRDVLQTRLTLVHILLQQGQIEAAVAEVRQLGPALSSRPAVVATIVALLERSNKKDEASKVFDQAVQYWDNADTASLGMTKVKQAQILHTLIEKSGEFKLRVGFHKEAIALFDRLLKEANNLDEAQKLKFLSKLVIASAKLDPVMSAKYAQRLPALEASSFNLEELEETSVTFNRAQNSSKRKAKDDKKKTEKIDEATQKKKKKKRKKRYPKGFDPANPGPPPDPERWLPKWERTVKKSKRRGRGDKHAIRKGAQGGAVGDENMDATFSTFGLETEQVRYVAKPSVTPAQRRQQRKKKKGKKK